MMNRLKYIFIGFLITFSSAWLGLAIAPTIHYRGTASATPTDEAATLIEQGRKIYRRDGCIYCHSQQVSPRNFRSDQARGWGRRRTVASDYRNDRIALFGTMRTGPDLANIGSRNPSPQWHYLHLYNPQITSKGSIMPPFRFYFQQRKASTPPGPDAVPLGNGDEILPTAEGRALVAYLISLKHDVGDPPEAFEPPAKQ